jgi:AcrR family transcriptional regulator
MKIPDQDRRVVKTREAIQDALFTLMQEKPYHKITIQDIIDRANVGRSTFYSHFETKEELLFSSIEHLMGMLNIYLADYLDRDADRPELIPVVEMFEHIKENNRVIKGLMKSNSSELLFSRVQLSMNSGVEQYLKSRLPENKEPRIPVTLLANHISSTLIQLLKWWLDNKMKYTPTQMNGYYQELINPVIDSVLFR